MDEIILHHYPTSAFSERVRLAFGMTKLAWRCVGEINIHFPRADFDVVAARPN